jgi:Flp pilus assembly protein TadG
MQHKRVRDGRKGVTLIVTAALLAGVLPMLGLAIDASFLYTIKAKLSAAVDAAALAGARSLSRGTDLASQIDNAKATAQLFFNANFPEGHLGTKNRVLTMEVAETTLKTRTVTITGTVEAPSYFLRFMGIGNTTLKAGGVASRRDVNLVLVLDRSGSMTATMPNMKQAAVNLVNLFVDGRDNLGLIVFSGGATIAYPPAPASSGPDSSFKSASPNMATQINNMVSGGPTSSADALSEAYKMLQARNEAGSLNVIVFFTDGNPNGLTADYNQGQIKPTSSCTYGNKPDRPMLGFIARGAGICDLTAYTLTLADNRYRPISKNSAGCAFASSYSNYRPDVARFPDRDMYLNQTNGPNRYVAADLTGVTDSTQIGNVSLNAADSAVQRIRQDTSLGIVIYSIGLKGGGEALDSTWLKRIANDPSSVYYSATVPQGRYAEARTPAELSGAFATIASEILRLAM